VCPGKPGAGNPHAGFYLGGEAQGQPRLLPTDHAIDPQLLLAILRERLHDNRFLRLIQHLLQAGYVEQWTYHVTPSGTPQGSGVSPILTNIYLDKLDQFVEQTLLPRYNHGETRQTNPAYRIIHKRMHRCKQAGQPIEARELRKALQRLPQGDPYDPHYRRLRYARYADGTPVQT
jgi:hypothetical protein